MFVGIQILMPTLVRPNLLSSKTVTFPLHRTTASQALGIYTSGGGAEFFIQLPVPPGAWVTAAPPVENSSGRGVSASSHSKCLFPSTPGGETKAGGPDLAHIVGCLTRYDLHESVTYQPASNYWPLQWYETGIFLGLAAALSGSCFWWIRRRRN